MAVHLPVKPHTEPFSWMDSGGQPRVSGDSIDALDAKIERLNTLLTENLIEMKGEIGEVKGRMTNIQSHAHTHTTS